MTIRCEIGGNHFDWSGFLHWQAVNVKLRQRTTLIGWTGSLNFTLTASSCKPNSASQLHDFYTDVEGGQARGDHS